MLEANATAKDVLYLAKPDLVDETMPKAKAKGRPTKFVSKVEKGQLVFKMTKDAEPTMEKCVICGLGADVILEKKSMVRICHGCQEVTAATSDTQPPAVPGSGAAGGGGALEVPGLIAFSKVKRRISKRSRANKPVEKGHSTGVCCCVCFKQLSTNRRPGLVGGFCQVGSFAKSARLTSLPGRFDTLNSLRGPYVYAGSWVFVSSHRQGPGGRTAIPNRLPVLHPPKVDMLRTFIVLALNPTLWQLEMSAHGTSNSVVEQQAIYVNATFEAAEFQGR